MRLAHLTDLHLPLPARPHPRELLNKRILGYLSWRRTRRRRHRIDALDALVADLTQAAPDFTAISGDLLNIALESEFSAGAQWLKENFKDRAAGFAPGNHDTYVAVGWRDGLGLFANFMNGDRAADATIRPPSGPEDFPYVRIVNEVGIVFANSAPPTAPGLATGRLGQGQIERIGVELERLAEAGKCRVLVLHHPVTAGAAPRRKELDDRAALRKMLFNKGVELVLHGHTHRSVWAHIETKDGLCPVIGGGSASHPRAHGVHRPARYNLFSIARAPNQMWRIDVEVRELDPTDGVVKTAEIRTLQPLTN